MQQPSVRAIIFDLYGVLAINGWQSFKAKHFSGREDIWNQIFQLGRQVDAGLADYNDLIRFTAEKSGESQATVRYQLEHTVLNEELLAFIEHDLKPQHKLGILSNASSNKVIDELFTPKQEALFDAIVLSHHVGLTKPQVEMYEAIAARLHTDVSSCLFIDDQERHAAGARYAGMQTVLYQDFDQFREELEKILADS